MPIYKNRRKNLPLSYFSCPFHWVFNHNFLVITFFLLFEVTCMGRVYCFIQIQWTFSDLDLVFTLILIYNSWQIQYSCFLCFKVTCKNFSGGSFQERIEISWNLQILLLRCFRHTTSSFCFYRFVFSWHKYFQLLAHLSGLIAGRFFLPQSWHIVVPFFVFVALSIVPPRVPHMFPLYPHFPFIH